MESIFMDNNNMLNEMIENPEEAIKSITVSNLGYSVLQPQYFNQFVREATRNQTILSEARRIVMDAQVVNIDRTGFSTRLMENATEDVAPTGTNPAFAQEQLIAKEFVGMVGINDRSLRRNIEKQNFQSTLISMASEKWGEDWESLAVFGDTAKYSTGDLLKSQDGWIKKATNKLYGTGTGKDFTGTSVAIDELMKQMLQAYPKNYLKNRSNLRFYLPSELFDDYIDAVGQRPTYVGDDATGQNIARPYKGVPVREATVLNDTEGADTTKGYGKVAMLMDPNNMVYGIFQEVGIEPDRQPKLRKTDFVFSAESDQGFENPGVGVVALYNETKPSS